MQNKFLKNNFDLIRLFAAFQVALVHVFHIMEIETAWVGSFILHLLYLFPGVPIFFFISGFLISRSYENNSCLRSFSSIEYYGCTQVLLFALHSRLF